MFRYPWYRHPFVEATRHRLGPAWRWKLAGESLDEEWTSSFDRVDRYVRWVWLYRRQVLFGPDFGAVTDEFWNLCQGAESIQVVRSIREEMMLMVLGECLPPEIADWYGFDENVVRVWEGTYFDVRDGLRATDWLNAHIIEPERQVGNLRCAAKLSLALRGGPEIAKRLSKMESSPPTDDTQRRQVEELELAVNSWIAVNQPFRSEKDMQQMLRYKQQLDDIEHQAEAAREPESENERYLREALEKFQFQVGNPLPFWSSPDPPIGPVAETDPAVDRTNQG